MKQNIILSVLSPDQQEVLDFSILFGVFLLVALATLAWVFRSKKKKRRKRKHHHSHSQNQPTRAQTGGLPPLRPPADKSGSPPA